MPPIPVITRYPRPAPKVALPQSDAVVSPALRQLTTKRRLRVPERLRGSARVAVGAALALVLIALLASRCTPQARASEPLPELSRTLSQLDRIHDALWLHEGERCAKHLGGRCL